MDDPIQNELRKLLGHLSTGLTEPERWQDWQIEPIFGGANNLLFRATGEPGDFAIKFTIRDERDRAGREYNTLLALQDADLQLAPKPIFLDQERYEQPVVVQSWLTGEMVQKPPQTDREWSNWLHYLAMIHEVSPEHTTVDLQNCLNNSNGAEGYAQEGTLLCRTAQEEGLPLQIVELTEQLTRLPLDGWQPVHPRLCRADHNIRNFILHGGSLKSVDWEYSGWGDPAEDIAEMMSHVTYMDVPKARWESVIEEYAALSKMENVGERIRICLAIKIVGWAVRIARSLAITEPDRTILTSLRGEWRVDTKAKYKYYLERARDHFLHLATDYGA
jgi:thiamine kinase-like enzyme